MGRKVGRRGKEEGRKEGRKEEQFAGQSDRRDLDSEGLPLNEALDCLLLRRAELVAWAARIMPRALRRVMEPDDLVQEAFLRAVKALASEKRAAAIRNVPHWFHAVLAIAVSDALRGLHRQKRAAKAISLSGLGDEASSLATALPDPDAPSPLELAERREEGAAVLRALERLSPRRRQILTLMCMQGATLSRAARALDTTPAAASCLLSRAKSELRQFLAPRILVSRA
ncbi:MAG: sigma-70 family RNA polymerase sigma factor [Planctomycetes bacterium]|nr:sigma-70 family RNA polymerase sigma factor [Planctomycetota bacterium]